MFQDPEPRSSSRPIIYDVPISAIFIICSENIIIVNKLLVR